MYLLCVSTRNLRQYWITSKGYLEIGHVSVLLDSQVDYKLNVTQRYRFIPRDTTQVVGSCKSVSRRPMGGGKRPGSNYREGGGGGYTMGKSRV